MGKIAPRWTWCLQLDLAHRLAAPTCRPTTTSATTTRMHPALAYRTALRIGTKFGSCPMHRSQFRPTSRLPERGPGNTQSQAHAAPATTTRKQPHTPFLTCRHTAHTRLCRSTFPQLWKRRVVLFAIMAYRPGSTAPFVAIGMALLGARQLHAVITLMGARGQPPDIADAFCMPAVVGQLCCMCIWVIACDVVGRREQEPWPL